MPDTAISSSPIDLSRLPAPTVVEQLSYAAIFDALVTYLQSPDVLPEFDATVESDPAVKLLEVFAWRELLLRQQFRRRLVEGARPAGQSAAAPAAAPAES